MGSTGGPCSCVKKKKKVEAGTHTGAMWHSLLFRVVTLSVASCSLCVHKFLASAPAPRSMGIGGAKCHPSEPAKKDGTTLVEMCIDHMQDAHDRVGVLYPDGETVMVPVTLVPRAVLSRILCVPVCWVSIPHGFAAVVSRCGADVRGDEHDGSWGSGGNCFPPWSTVHRLVTRQLIIFDAPVKECKTKDNITVNLDVLIEVEILDAITFIYTLGPEKLDDLLRASQEEVLRHWCFETPVANIYDLHGNSDDAVARMNKTFETYGVRIHNFTVTGSE